MTLHSTNDELDFVRGKVTKRIINRSGGFMVQYIVMYLRARGALWKILAGCNDLDELLGKIKYCMYMRFFFLFFFFFPYVC